MRLIKKFKQSEYVLAHLKVGLSLALGLIVILAFFNSSALADTPQSLIASPGWNVINGYNNTLSWQDSDPGNPSPKYHVYYFTSGASSWTQIGGESVTGTSYIHTGLVSGKTYYYRVFSVNNVGDENPAYASTSVLSSGGALNAIANDDWSTSEGYHVHLGWQDNDIFNPSPKYRIYVSSNPLDGSGWNGWSQLAEVMSPYFKHLAVNPNTEYAYRIYGLNSVNVESAEFAFVEAKVLALPSARTFTKLQYGLDGYTATQDTTISSFYPNQNYGASTKLGLTTYGVNPADPTKKISSSSLIKFDLTGRVPSNATIINATINIYSPFEDYQFLALKINKLTNTWDESTATWNNLGGGSWVTTNPAGVSGSFSSGIFSTGRTYLDGPSGMNENYIEWESYDISEIAQDAFTNNNGLVNLIIRPFPSSFWSFSYYFYSKEAALNYRPYLTINYLHSPTLDPSADPLATPSLSGIEANSSTQIKVSLRDLSNNEDDFHIYKGLAAVPTVDSGQINSISTLGTGKVYTKIFNGLSPNTQYFVRTKAHNHNNNRFSGYSNELFKYTLANKPTNLKGQKEGVNKVKLSWNANSNPAGTTYEVIYNNNNIIYTGTGTTFTHTTLANINTYKVRAKNNEGVATNWSSIIEVTADENPHANYTQDPQQCAICHSSHTATLGKLLRGPQNAIYQADFCYNCHDGTGSVYNVKADIDSKLSHHPIKDAANPSGTLDCISCHDPHGKKKPNGSYFAKLLRSKDSNGNKFYEGNEFCGACHGPNSQLEKSPANARIAQSKPGDDHLTNYVGTPHDVNLVESPSGTKIKCVVCHDKHASNNNKLLNTLINGLVVANSDNGVCFTCHKKGKYAYSGKDVFEQTKHSKPSLNGIVDTSNSDYAMGSCKNCHNPHGMSYTDYRRKDKNRLCQTCHDKKAPLVDRLAMEGVYTYPIIRGVLDTNLPNQPKNLGVDTDFVISVGKLAQNTLGPEDKILKASLTLMLKRDIYGINYFVNPIRPIKIFLNTAPTSIGAYKIGEYADPMFLMGTRVKQYNNLSGWLNENKNEQISIIVRFPGSAWSNMANPIDYVFYSQYEDNQPVMNSSKNYYAYQGKNKFDKSAHGSTTNLNTRWPNSAETGSGIGTGGATEGECINCHNPHGKKDENGKPYAKMLQNKGFDLCFTCHDRSENSVRGINIKERFTLADTTFSDIVIGQSKIAKGSARHSVIEPEGSNKLECTNCHNPHLNNAKNKIIDPNNKSALFTAKTTDPVSGKQVFDYATFCLKCHSFAQTLDIEYSTKSMRSEISKIPYKNNYHGGKSATGTYKNGQTRDQLYGPMKAPYSRGMGPLPCTTCHDEHGSSNILHIKEKVNGKTVKMKRMPTYGYSDARWSNLCTACHEKSSIINAHGPVNCGNCHNPTSTKWFGNIPEGLEVPCANCHSHAGSGKGNIYYSLMYPMSDLRTFGEIKF